MQYEYPSGFRSGVNLQSACASPWATPTPSIYAPSSYTRFGDNVGFKPPNKDWKASLYVKNLANDKHIQVVQPIYNANGQA